MTTQHTISVLQQAISNKLYELSIVRTGAYSAMKMSTLKRLEAELAELERQHKAAR